MAMSEDDIKNLLYLEKACQIAESKYNFDPNDADNLTRWGEVLLELSQFQSVDQSMAMMLDAKSKLEEALLLKPSKHDAVWCLGNVHMAHGLMTPDYNVARNYFVRAAGYYQQAVDEDPTNAQYAKSLETIDKAREFHMGIHKRHAAGAGSSASHAQGTKKGWNFDLIFDIFGWVVLGIGIGAWIGFARAQVHPSPSY